MVSQSDHSPNVSLFLGVLLQGRFRPVRQIGSGPVTSAYLGEDHQQGDHVILKLLALPSRDRLRVRNEVMAAWDVRHDHLVPIRGFFEDGERCVVVMDYVDGPDLDTLVSGGPLSPDETAAVGRGIALGLQAAHRRGILHRHVTPRNILVAAEVRARLGDLGSAGHGQPQGEAGHHQYVAPEILSGQAADARADVFGLGMSLYFALTGRWPQRQAAADGHRPSGLRPTVPPWLDDAIAQATAALPADRFSSAGRLAEALTPASARREQAAIR